MGKIIFNNISSEDLGLVVQTPPSYEFPAKDVESTHVIGRNGDVVIDNSSYKNVTRTYNVASVFRKGTNFVQNANRIVEWLYSSKGYARLEDTYEPDYYRKAVYSSGGDNLSNYYDEATVIKISFVCQPQRWLKIGEEETKIQNGESAILSNPTKYTALPKIEVKPCITSFTLNDDIVKKTISMEKGLILESNSMPERRPLIINYRYLMDRGYTKVKIIFRHLATDFETYIILDINKLKNNLSKKQVTFRIFDDKYNAPSNLLVTRSLKDGELVVTDYIWSEKKADRFDNQYGAKLTACYANKDDYPLFYGDPDILSSDEYADFIVDEYPNDVSNNLQFGYDENHNRCYVSIIKIVDVSNNIISTIEFQQEHNGKIITYNTITLKSNEEYINIDSEISECYNDKGYQNQKVSATDGFPYLLPGETNIKVTNCDITIIPRWWTL